MGQDTWKGSPWQPWTQNVYSYVGGNPVNYVDPTGHNRCTPEDKAAGVCTVKQGAPAPTPVQHTSTSSARGKGTYKSGFLPGKIVKYIGVGGEYVDQPPGGTTTIELGVGIKTNLAHSDSPGTKPGGVTGQLVAAASVDVEAEYGRKQVGPSTVTAGAGSEVAAKAALGIEQGRPKIQAEAKAAVTGNAEYEYQAPSGVTVSIKAEGEFGVGLGVKASGTGFTISSTGVGFYFDNSAYAILGGGFDFGIWVAW